MWDVDFAGIGVETVTMLAGSGIDADAEGKVAKVSGDKEADLCSAEDIFYGVIAKYDEAGGVVAVDRKGFKEVSYSEGAPSPGRVALVADGAGGVKVPAAAVAGSLGTGVEGDNNAITWTARDPGAAGADIRVQLKDPSGNSQALAIDVVGKDVIVSLATDGTGDITSTPADIISALATSAAAVLVTAANTGESTGAAAVVAEALTALAGGSDASASKTYDVVSVDSETGTLVLDLG